MHQAHRVDTCLLAWASLGLLALTGFACAAEPPPAARAAALLPPVSALIGDAACDTAAQCHSIGVGAKACGGPAAYLAWSGKNTDEGALRAAVRRHADAQREEEARAGMNSNCMVTPDPGASCVPVATGGSRCQLNARGNVGAQ